MPQIKIDYFRVGLPDDSPLNFEDLVVQVFQRPAPERVTEVAGGWIQLLEANGLPPFLRGTVVRAKADEIPPAADRQGGLHDLLLANDQGIAGLTHFHYAPGTRVLLLQRNYQGVRSAAFENYLTEMTGVTVELFPILEREAFQRLQRFQVIRKIQVKVANPQALVHFRLGSSVEHLIEIMNEVDAPVAELSLQMGYQRGSLNRSRLLRLIERLLRSRDRSNDVQKIIAFGREHEDERNAFIDLLQERIVETADVPLGPNRRLSEVHCAQALVAAYNQRRDELEELLGG